MVSHAFICVFGFAIAGILSVHLKYFRKITIGLTKKRENFADLALEENRKYFKQNVEKLRISKRTQDGKNVCSICCC